MKTYIILHPKNGELNPLCIRGQYEYEQVALIRTKDLETAFKASQNDFSISYSQLGIRSTSVGDIIIDVRNEKHYFVSNVGFTEIPHTVTNYVLPKDIKENLVTPDEPVFVTENKIKNIHVLATNKPSRLHITLKAPDDYDPHNKFLNVDRTKWILYDKPKGSRKNIFAKNIYITSDEEIKDSWSYDNMMKTINKIDNVYSSKIILTTDQDLIKDGVQAIDDDFLNWFVKTPTCKYVEVKKGFADGTNYGYNFLDYKIIIPKEESKQEQEICNNCGKTLREQMKGCSKIDCYRQFLTKQETLEEAAKEFANNSAISNYEEGINVGKYQGFIEGAKYQAERMYSKEDVIVLLQQYRLDLSSGRTSTIGDTTKIWFDQLKKDKP